MSTSTKDTITTASGSEGARFTETDGNQAPLHSADTESADSFVPQFDMNEIMNCMRCGFCLPACPTFRETGKEYASPRGRIALMKGIASGQLAIDQDFEDNMYLCLGCRACESACPAGVKYGRLVENARDAIETVKSMNAAKTTDVQSDLTPVSVSAGPAGQPTNAETTNAQFAVSAITANEAGTGTLPLKHTVKRTAKESFVRNLVFRRIFLHPSRVEKMGTVLWAAQTLGLQKFADKTGLMRILPRSMAEMQKAVPKVASPAARRKRRNVVPAAGHSTVDATGVVTEDAATSVAAGTSTDGSTGSKTIRVGMFKGCVMDVMFFEANEATARVLSKAGCEVVFVEDQACCGALHAHSGEQWGALDLAKRNLEAFEKADIDYVVNNAGGCGAALCEYGHWFEGDPEWRDRAKAFVVKLMDANELLAKLPEIPFTKEVHARVTYQDSCHLRHGQGIWKQPRDLIRQLPGIDYVELPGADQCCGSAGIYNITNFDLSMKILDDKMDKVADTKANVIVTSNPGCLLQMRQGIIRAGLSDHVEAVHIMELLNRAL